MRRSPSHERRATFSVTYESSSQTQPARNAGPYATTVSATIPAASAAPPAPNPRTASVERDAGAFERVLPELAEDIARTGPHRLVGRFTYDVTDHILRAVEHPLAG